MEYKKTYEGQRKADLENGSYINPVIPGDKSDPTILKDGKDYYMTFSSFFSYPGIIIWHSRDLVNWSPVGPALTKNIGSIWALDLVKHNNRYYIYIPAVSDERNAIYVIYADSIEGPWSEPVDLHLDGCIDPGHAVGEDGKRYLFLNGIRKVRLSDDGLSTDGELEKAYEPWQYPEDWVVEMFAPEGPKLLRKGGYFYLVSAVGGTSGPPTSHMVIVARSLSIHGPWEDCPHNPIIRTKSADEPWWSRGHATPVEGPGGDWWIIYHGYENNFRTLGRQLLLEPIRWTDDGWIEALGGDLSKPIQKPAGGEESRALFPLSDDFSANKFGTQWSFFNPGENEEERVEYKNNSLLINGKGDSLKNCSPLTFIVGDRSYCLEVSLLTEGSARGGLILYYNEAMFCGVGFCRKGIHTYNYGHEHGWMEIAHKAKEIRFRLENRDNIVTYHYSLDNGEWIRHPWQMEVSGMHHNVFGGFTSLKPGLFSLGNGKTVFKDFTYSGL